MAKSKVAPKNDNNDEHLAALTLDMQRIQADFENYRKQVEREKTLAREAGQNAMVMKLLPVIDNIDRATKHMPEHLANDSWAQGVAGLAKQVDKALEALGIARIDARVGSPFNPDIHEAVQFEDDAAGDQEVVAEELQAGYTVHGTTVRPAMVKVTRQ